MAIKQHVVRRMRCDSMLPYSRARVREKERREHMWRVAKAVVGSLVAGGAGLIFGFAMGLHDARWSDAWTHVGDASSPFSAQQVDADAASHG